jgi:RNA polymerase sigma-70 factor (ECF subfamily)
VAAIASPLSDPAAERAALLYEQHHGAILGYCVWRLRRRDDAEEAAQTTFTRALGALRRGQLPRNERAWLVTIARNVCTTLGTAPHRAREIVGDVPDGVSRETDHGLEPELEIALAALPDGQRRALLLREWQDLSYREIAAELGVSVGTVETWIFRARRSLASALEHTRRGFGLAGLLRSLAPGAGVKVAGAAILATAAVATEQAVVTHGSADAARPATRHPLATDSTRTAAVAAGPRVHATATRAHRTASVRRNSATTALAGGTRGERRAEAVGAPVSQPAEAKLTPKHDPDPPATPANEPLPAPVLPTVEAPELPLPAPTLPPVETPDLPAPSLPALPALPVDVDLPVDAPTLP